MARKLTKQQQDARDRYCRQYRQCQYTLACGQFVDFGYHFSKDLQLEHIWNRTSPKHCEHFSNYARVCPAAHDWKHANSAIARIAITWYKWRLATVMHAGPEHFDRAHIKEMTGQDPVGWVAHKVAELKSMPARRGVPRLPEWCERKADQLLEACV